MVPVVLLLKVLGIIKLNSDGKDFTTKTLLPLVKNFIQLLLEI